MCNITFGLVPALLLIFGGFCFGVGFHLVGKVLK